MRGGVTETIGIAACVYRTGSGIRLTPTHRNRGTDVNINPMNSPEFIAQVRKLYDEGYSYDAIAQLLSTPERVLTKGVTCGIGRRNKFPPRKKGRQTEAGEGRPAQIAKNGHGISLPRVSILEEPAPTPESIKAIRKGVRIYDLETRHCRWPLWSDHAPADVEAKRYCGEMRRRNKDDEVDSVYCAEHHAMSVSTRSHEETE